MWMHLSRKGQRAARRGGLMVLLWLPWSAAQASVTYISPGTCSTIIPDATTDNNGNVAPGVYTCAIDVSDVGIIPIGTNPVTISLQGLAHEASGDLIATVQHFADFGQTMPLGPAQNLFYRIGKLSSDPNDFGFAAQFGDCTLGCGIGDNYDFNSGFPASGNAACITPCGPNLWAAATGLGSADAIPGDGEGSFGYWPTDGYAAGSTSGAPNGFSEAFGGQQVSGAWVLTITDNAPGPTGTPGSMVQWMLTLDTTVTPTPEPVFSPILALGIGGGVLARRWQRKKAARS
jgi:hypothetical protein